MNRIFKMVTEKNFFYAKLTYKNDCSGNLNPENPVIQGILIQTIELEELESGYEESGGGVEV